ncbi:hypothetical protein DFS34DRAFT_599027 [Phlyctochytrium arcticum]|nr:hypothetical protein DFS34DRAFT_599027 [Phlyctochytrium arcticum]
MVDNKEIPQPVTTTNDGFNSSKKSGRFASKKAKLALCAVLVAVLLIIILPIIFLVAVPKIAQSAVNHSEITLVSAQLTEQTNSNFNLALKMSVANGGSVDATLINDGPLTVSWVGGILPEDVSEKPILEMDVAPFAVSGGNGVIDQTITNVRILNTTLFTGFNKFLIVSPGFKWRIQGKLMVRALGRTHTGLTMDKYITAKGMDRLHGTVINEFQPLAAPNPAAPLPMLMNATLINLSPIGLELPAITFNVTHKVNETFSIPLGQARSILPSTTLLGGGQATKVMLNGTIYPTQNLPAALQLGLQQVLLGNLNTDVIATPVNVDGSAWISNALLGLPLEVKLGKA